MRNESKAEGKAEGEAIGQGRALLAIFAARGLEVDDSTRERILACRELDLLESWLLKAIKVDQAQELFID